jgi:signal transduction histidine kinase
MVMSPPSPKGAGRQPADQVVDGIGIGRILAQVFVASTRSTALRAPIWRHGAGLHLTKARGLHGGTIRIDSQLGLGTTVSVTLPVWRWCDDHRLRAASA